MGEERDKATNLRKQITTLKARTLERKDFQGRMDCFPSSLKHFQYDFSSEVRSLFPLELKTFVIYVYSIQNCSSV